MKSARDFVWNNHGVNLTRDESEYSGKHTRKHLVRHNVCHISHFRAANGGGGETKRKSYVSYMHKRLNSAKILCEEFINEHILAYIYRVHLYYIYIYKCRPLVISAAKVLRSDLYIYIYDAIWDIGATNIWSKTNSSVIKGDWPELWSPAKSACLSAVHIFRFD